MDGIGLRFAQKGEDRSATERLVLSAVQGAGSLSRAEIARQTGLSAQSASVLTRGLEAEGLLQSGAPQKGKIGKPQTPMSLNPEGAFAFGLKIGRRKTDLVLLDLVGQVRGRNSITHAWPTPRETIEFLRAGIEEMAEGLSDEQRQRICGIGVAAPFELWSWLDIVGAPRSEMIAWRDFSFHDEVAAFSPLPVQVANDATVACSAELVFGLGREIRDYAYFYIGSFVGGGLVLDGKVWPGPTGNAGAFGSIPIGDVTRPDHQLLHKASLFDLERRLVAERLSADRIRESLDESPEFERVMNRWIEDCAAAIAVAAVSVVAVIDTGAIVIDTALPGDVSERLARSVATAFNGIDRQGLATPHVHPGTIGRAAGSIGAAYMPIAQRFLTGGANFAGRPGQPQLQ